MSSEGPLSSSDHAATSLQVQEPASPSSVLPEEAREASREGAGGSETNGDASRGEGSDNTAQEDEDASGRASLLSLDPETARAAQDVLDSEAEVGFGIPPQLQSVKARCRIVLCKLLPHWHKLSVCQTAGLNGV